MIWGNCPNGCAHFLVLVVWSYLCVLKGTRTVSTSSQSASQLASQRARGGVAEVEAKVEAVKGEVAGVILQSHHSH